MRNLNGLLLAALLLMTALAGCGSKSTPDAGGPRPDVAGTGKGAIAGLLIDDRYRPISDGTLLLLPTGETTSPDGLGQFTFTNLEPGSYEIRASAAGHEAAPTTVDVRAGEYTDVEVGARRVFSEAGAVITTQYTVFIPCAYDYVANGEVRDCTLDQSGDSYRPGFTADYSQYKGNATYLVSEMLANKDDRYEVQVRVDDGSSGGGDRFAVADFKGTYLRLVFQMNTTNTDYNGQHNNVPFSVSKPIYTLLFSDSEGREALQGIPVAGEFICCGAGVHLGIKAKFVQSLFIGPPSVPIEDYHPLQPK